MFAKKVFLIHRRDELRASKIMQDRIFMLRDAGKVEIVWDPAWDPSKMAETAKLQLNMF